MTLLLWFWDSPTSNAFADLQPPMEEIKFEIRNKSEILTPKTLGKPRTSLANVKVRFSRSDCFEFRGFVIQFVWDFEIQISDFNPNSVSFHGSGKY